MEKVFRVETEADRDALFAVVGDLSTYPQWIDVVHRVDPVDDAAAAGDSSYEPEWWVTLRAQVGPLARSKRLRMRRSINQPPSGGQTGHVRFERAETDQRDHAEWTMEVVVGSEREGSSWADCRLFYGGSLWNRLLDGQLDLVAKRATAKLQDLVAARL